MTKNDQKRAPKTASRSRMTLLGRIGENDVSMLREQSTCATKSRLSLKTMCTQRRNREKTMRTETARNIFPRFIFESPTAHRRPKERRVDSEATMVVNAGDAPCEKVNGHRASKRGRICVEEIEGIKPPDDPKKRSARRRRDRENG